MRLLLPLIAVLLCAAPVAPQETTGAECLIVFRKKNREIVDLVYTNPLNVDKDDRAFPFEPVDGCRVVQHYTYSTQGLIHLPHPVPDTTPKPDVDAFLDGCAEDPTLDAGGYIYALRLSRIKERADRKRFLEQRASLIPLAQKQALEIHAQRAHLPLE
jgi:hypothetical protein